MLSNKITLELSSISSLHLAVLSAIVIFSLPFLIFLWHFIQFHLFSPLKDLPRVQVKNANAERVASSPGIKEAEWMSDLGSDVITWKNDLGFLDLYVSDPKAMNWILSTQGYKYPMSEQRRRFLSNTIGDGILVAVGDVHKRQRKALGPAFHPNQLKPFVSVFFKLAHQLMDRIAQDDSLASTYPSSEKSKVVNVEKHFGCATLDAIGQCGFSFNYNSISGGSDLSHRIAVASKGLQPTNSFERWIMPKARALSSIFPFLTDTHLLRANRSGNIITTETGKVAKRILEKRFDDLKAEIAAEGQQMDHLKKEDLAATDIVDRLVRASIAEDVKETEKLNMKELIPLLCNITSAGAETTSTSLSSLMIHLGRNPQYQHRLQKELDELFNSLGGEDPDWDHIDSLPFLNAVVSEGLRLINPVPYVHRVSSKDDMIPLSKPIMNRKGNKLTHLRVTKGTNFLLGIATINRSKEIWGEDANEFNPDRWDDLKSNQRHAEAHFPVYNHYAFSNGPKICIGSRFAITETKCLIATILRRYNVEACEEVVWKQFLASNRVVVKGKELEGAQNPIRFTERS